MKKLFIVSIMLFFLKGFMYGSLKIEQCIELTDPTKLSAINQVAFNGNIALFAAIADYSQINPFTKRIDYDYTQIHLHSVNSPSDRPSKGVIKCVKPVEKIAFTDNSLWVLSHVDGKSLLDSYEVFTTNDSITTEKKKSVVIPDLCVSALVSDGQKSLMLGAEYGAWEIFDQTYDINNFFENLKEMIQRSKEARPDCQNQKVINAVFNNDGNTIAILSEDDKDKSYVSVRDARSHNILWERDFQGHLNQLFFPLSSSTDKVVALGQKCLVEMNSSNHQQLQLAALLQSCSSIAYNSQEQSFIFPGMNVEAGSHPALQLLKYDAKGQPSNIKELLIIGDAESMQFLFRCTNGDGNESFIYGTKHSLAKGYILIGRQQDLISSIQENLCSIS